MKERFDKIVVARFSPGNKCYVKEGIPLVVLPKKNVPRKAAVAHHFVDHRDLKTKSKYGWVTTVPDFTLSEFLSCYLADRQLSETETEHIRTMLCDVSKLKDSTPVTATYWERGMFPPKMVFAVHKVIFYPASTEKNPAVTP